MIPYSVMVIVIGLSFIVPFILLDGHLPDDIETQFANALDNIKEILKSENLDTSHVFKINIWLSEKINRDFYTEKWNEFHNQSPPATTLAYVAALARPEIKVEVEAWAARK